MTTTDLYKRLTGDTILNCRHEVLAEIHNPSPALRGFQGGCSDGKRYYYQILMHYDHPDRLRDYGRIAKLDLQTGRVVQWSEDLYLDHANDMTYHPQSDSIIVCHNKPHPQRITFLNAQTLTPYKQIDLPFSIYCIEYSAERDLYAVGLSGTREFRFLNADLCPIEEATHRQTPLADRCVKQGMCADKDLLYFILWDGRHKSEPDFQSRIILHDWSGTYKGTLHFDVGLQEPESISIVNGEILAVCGHDHPIVYKFIPQ